MNESDRPREPGPFSPPTDGMAASLGDGLAWLDRHINLEAIEAGSAGRHAFPTLDRISALMDAMGDPQHSYPLLHVTGTNGKGSTSRMAAALLMATGLNPGLYTSPHLERLNERLSVGGTEITDTELALELAVLAQLELFLGVQLTWFELVTGLAYRWFADEAADSAVVEVGLGGRWDATNVAAGTVAVVTNVGLDHTDILGGTREEIAQEKAGIVKPGSVVILGEEDDAIARIFEDAAREVGAAAVWRRGPDFGADGNRLAVGGRVVDLYTPARRYEDIWLPVHGGFQADNAAAALAAVQAFVGSPLDESVVADGFAAVSIPGRMEVAGRQPLVVLDGAHNAAGAAAAGEALSEDFAAARRVIVVMGCLRNRDPSDLIGGLGPERITRLIACWPPSPRALPATAVVAAAASLGVDAEDGGSVTDALSRALAVADADDLVLVTGSLYVVGAARQALRG
jgi:dihydrofolate synthase/folylpolyglutamate synthase